jgi:hypothetical protein
MTGARFYRLYLEIFHPADNTHGSVLLGGNSQEELDDPEKVCGADSAHCAAFPEACSVSVEMKVTINGKAETVVWTARLSSVVGEHPQHLELKRRYKGRLRAVQLDLRDAGALRLPLLPGDRIRWD